MCCGQRLSVLMPEAIRVPAGVVAAGETSHPNNDDFFPGGRPGSPHACQNETRRVMRMTGRELGSPAASCSQ